MPLSGYEPHPDFDMTKSSSDRVTKCQNKNVLTLTGVNCPRAGRGVWRKEAFMCSERSVGLAVTPA